MRETIFFQNEDFFYQGKDNPATRHEKLPVGTYLLHYTIPQGFFLELTKEFELPKKLYGNLKSRAEKILSTFEHRGSSTGVHLSGEKGSGKTLLTKLISTIGAKQGLSTIIVNFAASGDQFNTFLQNIEQPVILLFDEFEKVYDEDSQLGLLSLLDGLFTSKKLFLLTSNNYAKINDNMKNRPGRIFYYLNFEGLDPSFIQEYGEDNLRNKDHLNNLSVLAGFIKPMNFDMLQAVVEESNRYNEPPMATLEMLNVKTLPYYESFNYEIKIPNKTIVRHNVQEIRANPLQGTSLGFRIKKPKKGKEVNEYEEITFEGKELIAMDGINGLYEYKKKDGSTLRLSRKSVETGGLSQVAHLID